MSSYGHRKGKKDNPRLNLLRQEVDQKVLKPFRSHLWSATVVREIDEYDCIEIAAERESLSTRVAVLYSSSGASNPDYIELSKRVDHIFFRGQPYMLNNFARGVTVPVESLDCFPFFLVSWNRQVDPGSSRSLILPKKPVKVLRLTAEHPIEAIIARLQQFTSVHLAAKLVERRAITEGISISPETIENKATGVAYSMRSALDYFVSTSSEKLNKRVLSLYYGTMAFAQAEMLASPSKKSPIDLDEVEGMTKQGHGLYTLSVPNGGFADLRIGVIATGFLPRWMKFLGYDTSGYPRARARTTEEFDKQRADMVCRMRGLFASIPEINDLFAEVFGGSTKWVLAYFDAVAEHRSTAGAGKKVDSTYIRLADRSGMMPIDSLRDASWPLAEITQVTDHEQQGVVYRARVDHLGHESWWGALPTYSSPFLTGSALILPTLGGLREYRTIAAAILYALSIMARYMPSAWQRIEGGDEDQYLALVKAALAVWERVLPEHFLASIAGERVHTTQPGSLF